MKLAEYRQLTAKKKQPKYRNTKTAGYDSKHESNRAKELGLMLKAGVISDLREQVPYLLIPTQRNESGKLITKCTKYYADFVYIENGKTVVEDAKRKQTRTASYIMKKKLMLERYGIEIREVY